MCFQIVVQKDCKHEELLAWIFKGRGCNRLEHKCAAYEIRYRKPYSAYCAECHAIAYKKNKVLQEEKEKQRRADEKRRAEEKRAAEGQMDGSHDKVYRSKLRNGGYVLGGKGTEAAAADDWGADIAGGDWVADEDSSTMVVKW